MQRIAYQPIHEIGDTTARFIKSMDTTYSFLFLPTGSESRGTPPNASYASRLALSALVICLEP